MSVDFSQLTKPSMVEEIDFESILAERKEKLISLFDSTDQDQIRQTLQRESEPLTKFLEENAYREVILRNRINNAALSVLLAFAEKTDLDAVVANYGIKRLLINEATADSDAVYETDDALRYRASLVFDSLSVAGPTSAYEYHALSADGRVADAKASSPAPAEALVTILQNDTETGAATDALLSIIQSYLNDDVRRPVADRLTVQSVGVIPFELTATIFTNNLPESDSLISAGPTSAYEYHALSADGRVADAKASSPAPAEALVTILQNDTETGAATDALLSIIQSYLNDDVRRPVADRLTVQSVGVIPFELTATIFTNNLPESDSLISAATAAVKKYLDESRRIGRSIYLSKIYNLLHVSGVVHVVISSPAVDVEVSHVQVAHCTNITINAGEA